MKKMINLICIFLFILSACSRNVPDYKNAIVLENRDFSLTIGSDGTALSLKHKATGQECLKKGIRIPAFALTQYRPYDNELQLSFPSKPKTFGADSVFRDGDDLIVSFRPERNRARIGVKITDDYIAFTLKSFDYNLQDLRAKRKTEIDEFTILQLPVRERENFGEWLNAAWDNELAINLLGTGPSARIDAEKRDGYRILKAGAEAAVKLEGTGAALITTSKSTLFDRIASVENDFNLPNGVKSRLSEPYKYSYYESSKVNPGNIDKHIAYAKEGGFRAFMIYYFAFSKSLGHFPWLPEYPNGIEDLKAVVKKITDAGMVPGIHIHYSKVMKNDLYVTPEPDPRLNLSKIFTLSKEVTAKDTVITVEENPEGCTLEGGRRFLKIGKELIEFEKYTTVPPYRFTGCKRGSLETKAYSFDAGCKFGMLDVDTWNIFVRIDQNTSLQKEIAERLGKICNEAGFRFVYFDGAEDVHQPYWYNIGNSQYVMYKEFSPEPLLAEGAAKAHFSWHILTRGNAFDNFRPELIKQAVRDYEAPEAEFVAKDFSAIDFGWVYPFVPDKTTVGMQPDMIEYVWSRAAAWDCIASLNGHLQSLDDHPRTKDNLQVIHRWEDARIGGYLTKEQKEQLKNLNQEHILLIDENGKFELQPCKQITGMPLDSSAIRSFEFRRNGKVWVVYWHTYGKSEIRLKADAGKLKLFENPGKEIQFRMDKDEVILPADGRRYIETSLSEKEIEEVMKHCTIK